MQVFFDFSTLYQQPNFPLPSSSNFSLDSHKLQQWWQKLSISEKLEICQISSLDILADLNDAINDATIIFQVNRKSQQKNLITSKKSFDEGKNLQIQEFRFNFVGKDVLPENIAQLISAYHAIIYTPKKTSQQDLSPSEESTLRVKEEHLDAFADLLQAVLTGERHIFETENYSKIYSAVAEYSYSKMSVFKGVKSSSVLKLLHKLISVSVLFENNLFKAFLKSNENKDSDSDVTTNASSCSNSQNFSNENWIPIVYQGFEVGNLDIDFEFADILMTTEYADQKENLPDLLKDIELQIQKNQSRNYAKKASKDSRYWRNDQRESSPDSIDSYTRRYSKKRYGTRYVRREQVYYLPKIKNNHPE